MCVRVAIDMGLFVAIVEDDPDSGPMTAKKLAERCQAEQLLLGR